MRPRAPLKTVVVNGGEREEEEEDKSRGGAEEDERRRGGEESRQERRRREEEEGRRGGEGRRKGEEERGEERRRGGEEGRERCGPQLSKAPSKASGKDSLQTPQDRRGLGRNLVGAGQDCARRAAHCCFLQALTTYIGSAQPTPAIGDERSMASGASKPPL